MTAALRVVTPVDGSIYAERPLADATEVAAAIDRARVAQRAWRDVPVAERAKICRRFTDAMVAMTEAIVPELAWQMGRPIGAGAGELGGFAERAGHMIEIAADALADLAAGDRAGFTRFIRREPVGVVLVVAAWNYPYLIAVNSVLPAIMAGNAVLLKHSAQTPLVAERFAAAFAEAGLPAGLFQVLHMSHQDTERAIANRHVDFVAFTGSVRGGHAIQHAAADRFVGIALELGGKDPAYVRADADLDHAIENLVDGAFFNSGQSCCAIERIYVHRDVHDRFVDGFVALAESYRLGNPLDADTNLGPMVRTAAADFVRGQVRDAERAGARALIDPARFAADTGAGPYLAPQVLVEVDHSMRLMTEETFGPVVGIMKVGTDAAAIAAMNDSAYGLTAAIWTADEAAAIAIGDKVETGTWFMNRCDYLDPALAWVGVKDSGRGCTLSTLGYGQLTRPKSFHLRVTG